MRRGLPADHARQRLVHPLRRPLSLRAGQVPHATAGEDPQHPGLLERVAEQAGEAVQLGVSRLVRKIRHRDGRPAVLVHRNLSPPEKPGGEPGHHDAQDCERPGDQGHAHAGRPLRAGPGALQDLQPGGAVPGPAGGLGGGGGGHHAGALPWGLVAEHGAQDLSGREDVGPLVHRAPAACSGAMYAGVPAPLDPSVPSRWASPKSSSFTRPSSQTNTFAGFEIPVQHASLVRVGEPLRHLLGDPQGLIHREWTLLNAPRQRLAPQQFHHQVRPGGHVPTSKMVTMAGWSSFATASASFWIHSSETGRCR